MSTTPYSLAITRKASDLFGDYPSLKSWAPGDGSDQTTLINEAISSRAAKAAGGLMVPTGIYGYSGNGIAMAAGVKLYGQGVKSQFKRVGTINAGYAGFNFPAITDAGIDDCLIDGANTTTTNLLYSSFGGDPMNSALTQNSSVWIKPGSSGISLTKMVFRHTMGYSVLIDADTADVTNTLLDDILIENCWQHLFGVTTAAYGGGWTGGIFARGDCRASASKLFSVKGLTIKKLRARRVNGNVFWMHAYGFDMQHQNINISDVDGSDLGRDLILLGNLYGGSVSGVTGTRIGYTTHDDTSASTPVFVNLNNAVGIDNGGYVRGVAFSNIALTSVNGEGYDLDGCRDCTFSNISLVIPQSGDPQYTTDSVASYGFGGSGNITRGIQTGNTSLNGGGWNIIINGGIISGCGESAVLLAFAKGCKVTGLRITHPAAATEIPIQLFASNASGDETACHDNVIEDNSINYPGPNWCVGETGTGWNSGWVNIVRNNNPLMGANYGEFIAASGSGSDTGTTFSTNSHLATSKSAFVTRREGFGSTAAWKGYSVTVGSSFQAFQISDTGPIFNVSNNGAVNTGALTTGAISSLGFYDVVATKRILAVGGFLGLEDTGTPDTAAWNSLDAASASPGNWCLFRYNKTAGVPQYSVSTDGSANRIWASFGSSGSATPAGSDTQIQFNSGGSGGVGGSLGASANFYWANSAQVLAIVGIAGTSGLSVANAYIQAGGGFVSTANAWNGFQSATDGALLRGYAVATVSSTGGYVDFAPLGYANFPVKLNGLSAFGSTDVLLWASATNATGSPNTTVGLQTNAFINAASGFVTSATASNAIQAPSGGVTAASLIATTAIYCTSGSLPAVSGAGQGKISFDGTHFKVSENGGAWAGLIGSVSSLAASAPIAVSGSTGAITVSFSSFPNAVGLAMQDTSAAAWAVLQIYSDNVLYLDNIGTLGQHIHIRPGANASSHVSYDLIAFQGGSVTGGNFLPGNAACNIGSGSNPWLSAITKVNYLQQLNLSPPASPGSGFGGLAYSSSGEYFYWDGTQWQIHNFSAPPPPSFATLPLTITSGTIALGAFPNNQALRFQNTGNSPSNVLSIGLDNNLYLDNSVNGSIFLRPIAGGAINVFQGSSGGTLQPSVTNCDVGSGGSPWRYFVGGQIFLTDSFGAPASPSGGFGGLGHKSGAVYWYWNGSSWGQVDFSASTGGGAVNSVTSGNGNIAVSPTTGSVVVTLSNNPTLTTLTTGGAISAGGVITTQGGINVTTVSSGTHNSVQTTGGFFCSAVSGLTMDDGSYVRSSGIFVPSGGVEAAGFNPFISGTAYVGQTMVAVFSSAFNLYAWNGTLIGSFTQLKFGGGSAVSYA